MLSKLLTVDFDDDNGGGGGGGGEGEGDGSLSVNQRFSVYMAHSGHIHL